MITDKYSLLYYYTLLRTIDLPKKIDMLLKELEEFQKLCEEALQ